MADNTNWNGWVTPDLARNPGLATDAYKSKSPEVVGPILSQGAKGVAAVDAINDHIEGNGTQTFWARLGTNTLNTLSWLGKPLKEVQKDYKFVHSIYTDHGFLPGFIATLGVAGAGVLGGLGGGTVGAIAAMELVATGERKLLGNIYKDSYAKSEDENYKVSPGRDFSNVLAKATAAVGWKDASKTFRNTNKGFGKFTSGFGDVVFDINADPFMVITRFATLMKTGKYVNLSKAGEVQLKYPIMESVPGAKNFIISRTGKALTSEQMDMVRSAAGKRFGVGAQYNRALEDIAATARNAVASSTASASEIAAGEIAAKYPQLGAVAAGRMSTLKTADEVHNFLKGTLYFSEMEGTIAGQAMLPSRTLLRAAAGSSKVVDVLRNAAVPKWTTDALGNRIKNPEWNPLSPKQNLSKIYSTFTGYMPYSVDPITQKLSLTRFRWNANDATQVIYRIARIGMGDAMAKEWAGKYAQAVIMKDQALARGIKNQALMDAFKALGLPNETPFVKKIFDEVNKLEVPVVSSQVFGVSPEAKILGEYISKDGIHKVGALAEHQTTDMFHIPDFLEIKKAMREYGVLKKGFNKLDEELSGVLGKVIYGKNDEFIMDRYTNKIFKPLALATAGFGLRVAAAEMLPAFARFGVMNTLKAKLAVAVAKDNYNLINQEKESIFSSVLVALGIHQGLGPDMVFPAIKEARRLGLKYAAKMLPDDMTEVAMRVILANNGHFLSEAVMTGHGYDADVSYLSKTAAHYYYQLQKNSPLYRDLAEYTTYSSSDIHYVPRLVTNLNKASRTVFNSKIAEDMLRYQRNYLKAFKREGELAPVSGAIASSEFYKTPEYMDFRRALIEAEYNRMTASVAGKFKPYDSERQVVTRWRDGDLHQFAEDRVDSTLGMLVGKDGTFHQDWAENLAKGVDTDLNKVAAVVQSSPNSVPAMVAGPKLEAYMPSTSWIETITNLGFKKVIDPIVNGLARETLYMIHVADAYERFVPMVAKGIVTEDQALRYAQTQASYAMLPQIHNTALRNQFAQLARNFLPFYFAQEQALKRAFNALKDTSVVSPLFSRAMRFYQLSEHAMSDPTFMTTDENGNKFVNIPLVGALGEGFQNALTAFNVPMISGLPISVKGSTVSLKSVLPELQTPGVAPFVAISGNLLADFFPSMKGIVQGAIGDISWQKGVLDTLFPAAWAKTIAADITSYFPGGGIDLQNQMNSALASALAAAYYHGDVPNADSNPQQRQAYVERIKNNARSILLMKTFLNLVSPLAPQVKQEDPGFRDEFYKMLKKHKNNYSDALQEFLAKHGTRAVSYTVGRTESTVRGLRLPYIQSTIDYINNNKEMFAYNSPVGTAAFFLIPQEGLDSPSDRTVYNELVTQHYRSQRTPEELLKQFYIAQGYAQMAPLITEHVNALKNAQGIPALQSIERDRWSVIMTKMKNLYPIWYSDYTDPERRNTANTVVNQLNLIFSPSNPNQPTHNQAKLVKGLLNEYNAYQSQQAQFTTMNIRGTASQLSKQDWEDYLMAKAIEKPELESIIYTVFLKLG